MFRHLSIRRLPSAAERFIQSHQGKRRVPLTLRKLVIGRIERSLGVEHGQEALDATLIKEPGNVNRLAVLGGFRCELITAHLRIGIGNQRRLHIAEGAEDRALVYCRSGGGARRFRLDLKADSARVEYHPTKIGADLVVTARGAREGG